MQTRPRIGKQKITMPKNLGQVHLQRVKFCCYNHMEDIVVILSDDEVIEMYVASER
jgi:hypothetical protein